VPDAPLPSVGEPGDPEEGDVVPEPLPPAVPEPAPWPGLRFSAALAARAVNACMVFSPDAGLLFN
jgi:hypothetical protein